MAPTLRADAGVQGAGALPRETGLLADGGLEEGVLLGAKLQKRVPHPDDHVVSLVVRLAESRRQARRAIGGDTGRSGVSRAAVRASDPEVAVLGVGEVAHEAVLVRGGLATHEAQVPPLAVIALRVRVGPRLVGHVRVVHGRAEGDHLHECELHVACAPLRVVALLHGVAGRAGVIVVERVVDVVAAVIVGPIVHDLLSVGRPQLVVAVRVPALHVPADALGEVRVAQLGAVEVGQGLELLRAVGPRALGAPGADAKEVELAHLGLLEVDRRTVSLLPDGGAGLTGARHCVGGDDALGERARR
mmetsp:Transcript_116823/g.251105  ORF Transcript_116823/g.251105 Transcript_116823/m.251105 type:complete len:303 (-) Transcript_116823:31-939(-)